MYLAQYFPQSFLVSDVMQISTCIYLNYTHHLQPGCMYSMYLNNILTVLLEYINLFIHSGSYVLEDNANNYLVGCLPLALSLLSLALMYGKLLSVAMRTLFKLVPTCYPSILLLPSYVLFQTLFWKN